MIRLVLLWRQDRPSGIDAFTAALLSSQVPLFSRLRDHESLMTHHRSLAAAATHCGCCAAPGQRRPAT
ncbi:hypothetical protein E2C01_010728 [Portunus trituberculatus]|uniref:Uncharacterized protein n=1 Tax=Portunus trituberculatus TaxID=210409 RepID=A0A5B7D976_PORTR|nr:hypothetical protein [Portunus trituberculatus]